MKSLLSFMKKEFTEHLRTGKIFIILGMFVLLAVMNPAIAKLTPELVKLLAETTAQSGMTITAGEVTAMDSWVQFFKNMPVGLIVFILLESNIFTKEYQSGTLVLALTKGLKRYKVLISKTAVAALLWSAGFWMCFGITYGANTFFWDNSVAENLAFSAFCWWLFGMLAISFTVLFSTIAKSNVVVLAGTGGVIFGAYFLSMLPKIGKYLPTLLMDGNSLIYGLEEPSAYTAAIIVTAAACAVAIGVSVPVFNKKHI